VCGRKDDGNDDRDGDLDAENQEIFPKIFAKRKIMNIKTWG
jgi:hypothetical protein